MGWFERLRAGASRIGGAVREAVRGARAAVASGVRGISERVARGVAAAGARVADAVAPPPPPQRRDDEGAGGGGGGGGSGSEGWWDAPPGVSVEVVDELPEGGSLRGPFLAASDAAEYAADIPVPTRIVRVGSLFYVIVVYED